MKNTKGFTLVELLAVIVILAVVMMMAVTAIGPIMTRARKGALGEEGLALINAAERAYQLEQMKTTSKIKATSSACFSLNWLNVNQYFDKGAGNDYHGSVLISYDTTKKTYTYKFWISNGTYVFDGMSRDAYDYEKATDGTTASEDCGGQKGLVLCNTSGTSSTCTAK